MIVAPDPSFRKLAHQVPNEEDRPGDGPKPGREPPDDPPPGDHGPDPDEPVITIITNSSLFPRELRAGVAPQSQRP